MKQSCGFVEGAGAANLDHVGSFHFGHVIDELGPAWQRIWRKGIEPTE